MKRQASNLRVVNGDDSNHPAGRVTMNGAKTAVEKPVKLIIGSDPTAVRTIQDQILKEITRLSYDHQSHFAIKLALEEALINAMKHGNKWDTGKKVHVEYKINAKQFEMTVEDEGAGFARDAVPDPTLDENIEKCSGRGILLIEAYMNSVHWSRGGRRLHMVKKNEPDASS